MQFSVEEIEKVQKGTFDSIPKLGLVLGLKFFVLDYNGVILKELNVKNDKSSFFLDTHRVITLPWGLHEPIEILNFKTGVITDIGFGKLHPSKGIKLKNLKVEYPVAAFVDSQGLVGIYSFPPNSRPKKITGFKSIFHGANIYQENDYLYLTSSHIESWQIAEKGKLITPKKIDESLPIRFYYSQVLLSEDRSVIYLEDKLVLWNGALRIGSVKTGLNSIYQISNDRNDNNRVLCLGRREGKGYELQLYNFNRFDRKTYSLVDTYSFDEKYLEFLALDNNQVALINNENPKKLSKKLDLITGKLVPFPFPNSESAFRLESFFVIPSCTKILKCLLQVKLKLRLPRDLILETFNFLS